MRVVFAPGAYDRGADLLRHVGKCRACGRTNVAWIVRGHVITMATLACEYCGSAEGHGKKKKTTQVGIQWRPGSSAWTGRVMGQNYPELAKAGDMIL